jgi:predicted flap endonuclease-1-like 5' DNA nuclease
MIYLLAKYTLLFLLASALGFVLGHWWSRRNFTDVSESYQDLRKATEKTDTGNWEYLWKRLELIPEPQETDLTPVFERLDGVHNAVGKIPRPDTVNLAPVESRLESLGKQIASFPTPAAPKEVNLAPIEHRLRSIETEIGLLGKRLSRPVDTPSEKIDKPVRQTQESGQPRVLSAALYGKKDDLKTISGVGPKLESLLNKNGVYYFWQVASWSPSDIDIIDERLDVFKGRISRDDWVTQAKQLRNLPEAARMPAE